MVLGLGAAQTAFAQGAAASPPAHTNSAAERQMRGDTAAKAFVQGRYAEALDIYADLFAESNGRPEYLRNIGRCQQKLNQYDSAIESFREYLRRGKNIGASEKHEVEGFIAEMDAARRNAAPAVGTPAAESNGAAVPPSVGGSGAPIANSAVPSPPASGVPPSKAGAPSTSGSVGGAFIAPAAPQGAPTAVANAPVASASTLSNAGLGNAASPLVVPAFGTSPPQGAVPDPAPAPAPTSSKLRTAGIVILVASALLAVGGTVMRSKAWSKYNEGVDAGCRASDVAGTCASTRSSVDSYNSASKWLYAGAAATGATGLIMFAIAPSSTSPETKVTWSGSVRFAF